MGLNNGLGLWAKSILCMLFCSSPVFGSPGVGYKLTSLSRFQDGRGMVGSLKVMNRDSRTYGPDINSLRLTVRYETDDRLRVHITDEEQARWEIPSSIIPRMSSLEGQLELAEVFAERGDLLFSSSLLKFSYISEPFGFVVIRQANGEVLFNSTPAATDSSNETPLFENLVFKDQYIEISTQLPNDTALYGLGESTRPDGLRLSPGRVYTLWATDIGSNLPDIDLYGVYPFYMDVRRGGVAHAVLLFNSNGMDVIYDQRNFLTYRVIGGVLDFYFFAGPTPFSVVDQYTQLVGRPAAMPYWSFGFHQCRYGYKTLEEVESVVAGYAAAQIPLETMWSDIDYMDAYKDFTVDPVNYPETKFRAFVDKLHANGQKYVVILDPGIKIEEDYSTYINGLEADIYIKDIEGKSYLAQVWPGAVYYPDFLNPRTDAFWEKEIADFHERIPFDGLWIDMNEAANFCTGPSCYKGPNMTCPLEDNTVCCLVCKSSHEFSIWDDPPYQINCIGVHRELNGRTIAMSASHHNGVREYDVHNLFGLTQGIATSKALKKLTGKRPFVLSRSTFMSSGAYTAHWTGDNGATFKDLEYSIVSSLNSGMFGVPMVGADICGFADNTTEELCNRWIEVGAFYPFSRDHSDIHGVRQELFLWESVANTARKVLNLRYKLLPYYYTLLYDAHVTGAPIMRPLFFEFTHDAATLDVNTQFMIGNGILISPVVKSGERSVRAYIPKGTWYNIFNQSNVIDEKKGAYHILPTPLDTINVHLRQGSIIPMQEAAMTTSLARKTPFTLLVVFSKEVTAQASGNLFLDNDDKLDMALVAGQSTYISFSAFKFNGKGMVQATPIHGDYALQQQLVLDTVVIFGLPERLEHVTVNGVLAPASLKQRADLAMEVSELNLSLGESLDISWICRQIADT